MNRRCSMLDSLTLISNSDAHSPSKLGREANVLETEFSYAGVAEAFKGGDPKKFPYTIEFFPEEGKYHYDGHRECKVRFFPRESKERNNRCPVCYRPLTLGVMHRVEDLADKPWDHQEAEGATGQRSIIPLEELLADAFDCGPGTKKVQEEYRRIVAEGGNEFAVLLDLTPEELKKVCGPRVAEGIGLMRAGKVNIAPGYDGVFGVVSVFRKVEGDFKPAGPVQMKLV
jgi:PHP family Zn ribbon phosphoesterase